MNKDKWGGVDTPEECIRGRIEAFVSQDPGNCLRVFGDTPMFDAPLVRFADVRMAMTRFSKSTNRS
jgi:hypothetical protein